MARTKRLADYVDGGSASELLGKMIRAASVNPPGGERECARVVYDKLSGLGIDTELVEKVPGRTNVVAKIKGKKGKPTLLYNGHIDVVPPGNGWKRDPFGAEVVDGVMYGRGTADMKSGVASMVAAIEAIVKSGMSLCGDLILTAVADEETGSVHGTRYLIEKGLRADMAVVSEPTDLRVEIAEKGILWAEVTTQGRGSHASRPGLGVNAIDGMVEVIEELREVHLEGKKELFDVPEPVMSVTTIKGGTKINVIPDQCSIEIDRRLLPGESPEKALRDINDAIVRAKTRDTQLRASIRVLEEWPPMETPIEEPIVKRLVEASRSVTGREPSIGGKAAGTDAAWLVRDAGIPTALFGPGDPKLSHTPDEHVELGKVAVAGRVLAELMAIVLE